MNEVDFDSCRVAPSGLLLRKLQTQMSFKFESSLNLSSCLWWTNHRISHKIKLSDYKKPQHFEPLRSLWINKSLVVPIYPRFSWFDRSNGIFILVWIVAPPLHQHMPRPGVIFNHTNHRLYNKLAENWTGICGGGEARGRLRPPSPAMVTCSRQLQTSVSPKPSY